MKGNSMACVLAIETSRGLCSAAVLTGATVHERTREMERAHNEHILALVDQVMAARGLTPTDLDAVAFGCGPGSFTGIRIAASVAQALSFGADAQIVPVSSTLALARSTLEEGRAVGNGIIVSIRSRRDAWYLAGFSCTDGRLSVQQQDCLVQQDPGWPESKAGWTFVGDRPSWLPNNIICHTDVATTAALIAQLGAESLAQGEGMAPEFGLPVYVTGDSPWRKASKA